MKTIRKIFVILIVVCLLAANVVAQDANPTIQVKGGVAAPGETVKVTIELLNNPGIASAKLLVEYDADILTLESVEDAGKLGTQVHKPEFESPYVLTWANDTVTENYTYNGTVVTLTFKIADDAPEGNTPIEVSYDYDNYDIIDWQMNKVYFDVVDGVVTVGQVPPTDISLFSYLLSGNELTITGYLGEESKVVIGSSYEIGGIEYSVTAIGAEAFSENTIVETVVFPDSVKIIEEWAFYSCEKLQEVTFGDGLEKIGADAFDGCASLTSITFPKSLKTLDEYAFYDCTALNSVLLLNPETELGECSLGYYPVSRKKDGIVEGFAIKGHNNSTAQTYANANEITFSNILDFKGASLVLQDNLAINYKVDKVLFEEAGYTNLYAVFEKNGEETIVNNYIVDGDRYVFCFTDIAPQQMNDIITATLYATYDGVLYASEARTYSVAEYCYDMLESCTDDTYGELRKLIVDLLHYGAQAQIYADYEIENLVDCGLTDEQLSWGTSDSPVLETVLDTTYATIENPKAQWKGAGLYLQDSVTLRFKLSAESIEGLSVKIRGATQTWTVDSSEFVEISDGYNLYFNKLDAAQMSEKLYLTVYSGDVVVSNTVCYSIESYAYEMQNSTVSNIADLVKAMMKYGNSAYDYVN